MRPSYDRRKLHPAHSQDERDAVSQRFRRGFLYEEPCFHISDDFRDAPHRECDHRNSGGQSFNDDTGRGVELRRRYNHQIERRKYIGHVVLPTLERNWQISSRRVHLLKVLTIRKYGSTNQSELELPKLPEQDASRSDEL